jgi:hypothetical protein
MNKRILVVGAVGIAAAAFVRRTVRGRRNLDIAALGVQVGGTYASTAARKLFATAERRVELDEERELRTAEAITERLGNMKGALMKLGQMASYVSEGLPEPMRAALAELQSNAPPMSAELAAGVIESELGAPPAELFAGRDLNERWPSRCSTPASVRRSKPTCATRACSARSSSKVSAASIPTTWLPRSVNA